MLIVERKKREDTAPEKRVELHLHTKLSSMDGFCDPGGIVKLAHRMGCLLYTSGIKDYGTIFPGHGGILDRFDSVMFIAPFVTMVITAVFYY